MFRCLLSIDCLLNDVMPRLFLAPNRTTTITKSLRMAYLKRNLADISSSDSEDETPSLKTPRTFAVDIKENHEAKNGKTATSHWSQGLFASMKDHSSIISQDELTVTIKDKFPKARHHYLILSKNHSVRSLLVLQKSDPSHSILLERIKSHGIELKRTLSKQDPKVSFRFGFHASPSMPPLHAHLISQDFNSVFLKNKKHWNSFTTDFFRDFEDVEGEFQEKGFVAAWSNKRLERLLKTELKCHVCNEKLNTVPLLKQHIKLHIND